MSDMLGHGKKRTLFGEYLQQSWASLFVIERILAEYKPDCIIELGTGNGLLATYLKTYAEIHVPCKFLTMDINIPKIIISANYFWQRDITDPATVTLVSSTVNDRARPLVIVDGADPKCADLNLYAPTIKPGVIMLAHDCALEGSISGHNPRNWLFKESEVDWKYVKRHEIYYRLGVELDTRMLAVETISHD